MPFKSRTTPIPHTILLGVLVLLPFLPLVGCGWSVGSHHLPLARRAAPPPPLDNPLFVPVQDREFAWNQIVQTIDRYFQIERESRVRLIGGVLTEGAIDTFPLTGATYLEPWRRDSTAGYQRLQDTLQSTRRRAEVRVIPATGGYFVHVAVYKELEDLSQPEHSTVGSNMLRHDGTLVRQQPRLNLAPVRLGWIPLGRDLALEQRILVEIQGRLTDYQGPSAPHLGH